MRELDRDLLEARRLEPGLVLALRERAGDAADVARRARPARRAVRWSSATTSLIPIRPPGLSTRAISVSTAALSTERLITQFEITTSTESAGSGISSITPLRKCTFAHARLGGVAPREREHLVGHVQPVRGPGRPDALRREDHVDPAARAEIEHRLALAQVGHRGRVAAARARRAPPPPAARRAAPRRTAPRRTSPASLSSRPRSTSRRRTRSLRRSDTARADSAYRRRTCSRSSSAVVVIASLLSSGRPPRAVSRRARRLVAPGRGAGRLSAFASPITSSAADGKQAMQRSLIRKRLLAPRCSTSTKHVSASRRRCSDTVDWPTSTAATISPTESGRRSHASRFRIWIRVGSARHRNQLAYSSACSRSKAIVHRR